MALEKEITLDSGIKVKYHRIISVNNITNVASIIEVGSYTDEEKRSEEKRCIENKQPMNVFIYSVYLNIPYDENLNVVNAYGYLKSTERYIDAKDV